MVERRLPPEFLIAHGTLRAFPRLLRSRSGLGQENVLKEVSAGPLGKPIIGNLRSTPSEDEDIFVYTLGKKYSSILHPSTLGQPFILVNSVESAVDLLAKRRSNHSSKPRIPLTEVYVFAM
ncbi:hypothetical protein DXG01_016458 [Tephrocybe rancida]|nr:hypothetical protein DXG01_016458 [Tephrocybe rancida]